MVVQVVVAQVVAVALQADPGAAPEDQASLEEDCRAEQQAAALEAG